MKKEKIKITVSIWDEGLDLWIENYALVGKDDYENVVRRLDKMFKTFRKWGLKKL